MRLVLFSFIPDTRAGGMGNWMHEMAAALRERGHDVVLWFDDVLRPVRHGRAAVLLHPVAFAARAFAERARVDAFVVHEPSGFWYAWLRRMVPSLPPIVAMCHNVESHHARTMDAAATDGLAAPRGWHGRLRYALGRRWQSDGTIRRADHVVVLSSIDRQYVTSTLGREPSDVTLLLNGVASVASADDAVRDHGTRVLFVGGWLDVKGRRVLPVLWRAVRAVRPDARLTIAGAGADAARVLADFSEEDRASVDVNPRIEDRAAMRALYHDHDVFVMPSLSEGGPLALLEAMQAGLPIVASRRGGIPDLVGTVPCAVLFDPARPVDGAAGVLSFLCDHDRRREAALAGRARARELTWHDSAETLLTAVRAARGDGRTRDSSGADAPPFHLSSSEMVR